jgi:hypothetical protein
MFSHIMIGTDDLVRRAALSSKVQPASTASRPPTVSFTKRPAANILDVTCLLFPHA